jgi:hypothetical protein
MNISRLGDISFEAMVAFSKRRNLGFDPDGEDRSG